MYDAFGDKSRSSDAAHALRTYEERAHTDQAPTSCSKAVRAFNIRAWIELQYLAILLSSLIGAGS